MGAAWRAGNHVKITSLSDARLIQTGRNSVLTDHYRISFVVALYLSFDYHTIGLNEGGGLLNKEGELKK